jgi:hypothetical protein
MPRGKSLTLTDQAILGLFFIQRYRFLTIDQVARAADLNPLSACPGSVVGADLFQQNGLIRSVV